MVEVVSEAARRMRAVAIAGCFALGTALSSSASAKDLRMLSDARLYGLPALYASDDAVNIVSDICGRRFTETQTDWAQSVDQWRRNNLDSLSELERLQNAVGDAVVARRVGLLDMPTWDAIVNTRQEWDATFYEMLAPMEDAEARRYCDAARVGSSHQKITPAEMTNARTAAAAAIEYLKQQK